MTKIRTLVVDDEPMARERILGLLAQETDVEVIGQCADGVQAVSAIQQLSPELVFLDVQMPAVDGFGVIKQVGADKMPMVVFVTAYDEYALQAFEVHALDYLLKPFGRDRLQQCLDHARTPARPPSGRRTGQEPAGAGPGLQAGTEEAGSPGREVRRPRVLRPHRETSTGSRPRATTSACT